MKVECGGCGDESDGYCKNCDVPLCAACDSGKFDDVMVCRDWRACERRLRRKAVSETLETPLSTESDQ